MDVIVLMAGRGRRLGEQTEDFPKALLEFNGKSALDHIVSSVVRYSDPTRILPVVGFQSDAVMNRVGERISGVPVEYALNPDYDTTNTGVSLALALEKVTRDALLFNGDLVFSPDLLEHLVLEGPNSVLVDFDIELTEEAVKVRSDKNGIIEETGKHLARDESDGEYIGAGIFSFDASRKLLRLLNERIAAGEQMFYYDDLFPSLSPEFPVKAVSTQGGAWAEIDTPEDYEFAVKNVVPEL